MKRQGSTARGAALVALLATILAGGGGAPACGEDTPAHSMPFPLVGRMTVRADGKTYVIDGKQTIPGGSVIRVEGNVRIVGINKASLDVKGGLLVHGTQDCWVWIENVDFSPTTSPDNEVHFDMADMHGCRMVHAEGATFEGGFTIENSCFQSDCAFAIRMRSGYLRIMTTEFKMPCTIDANPDKGMPPEVAVRTSWMKALSLSGSTRGTIRDSEVRGTLEAKNFGDLVIDGCDLFSDVTLRLGVDDSFSKLQLLKCNLFSGTLTLDRPAGPKLEKVRLDKWYFEGVEGGPTGPSPKAVGERIKDGADDEKVSVKAFLNNPAGKQHNFVSKSLRRRAPP